jgi:uncharacterized protein YggT (Ycf19 family)
MICACLGLYLLSSYIYFGNQPFWNFVSLTGRNMVRPLSWLPLQIGKIDLAPLLAIALVFVASEFAQRGLTMLYGRVP